MSLANPPFRIYVLIYYHCINAISIYLVSHFLLLINTLGVETLVLFAYILYIIKLFHAVVLFQYFLHIVNNCALQLVDLYIIVMLKVVFTINIEFNLRNIRKLKCITQKELARRTGFSQSYISKLGTQTESPTLTTVCKLAEALGVHPYELIIVKGFKKFPILILLFIMGKST